MQSAPLKTPASRAKAGDDAKTETSQSLGLTKAAESPPAPETAMGVIGRPELPPFRPEPPRAQPSDPSLTVPKTHMFVLDTSAHDVERIHDQIIGGVIRKFTFKPRQPTPLPPEVAVKFLKSEGFVLTDAEGSPIEWNATPRQPHEMGAGEQISLAPNEVIASLDELNMGSLRKRALQMGASEAALQADKEDLIGYIKAKTLEYRRQRRNGGIGISEEPGADIDLEEFVPDASMLAETSVGYTL